MTIHEHISQKTLSGMDMNEMAEFTEDVNVVKTKFIDKLIEENKKLVETLTRLDQEAQKKNDSIKRDAALVMERLVADNAWYRDQNEQLKSCLENRANQQQQFKSQSLQLLKQKEQMTHEKRVLTRSLDTLREEKTSLEYQVKHLGCAFLTLREAVLAFLGHPLALEATRTDQSWESRRASEELKSCIISTIQKTHSLRTVLQNIDSQLVQLQLLDPLSTVSPSLQNSLTLMGEKLVPFSQVTQLKKERGLWQRRFFVSDLFWVSIATGVQQLQSDIARMKIQQESLVDTLKTKDMLIKKLQSDRKFSSLHGRTKEECVKRKGLEKENRPLGQPMSALGEVRRKPNSEKQMTQTFTETSAGRNNIAGKPLDTPVDSHSPGTGSSVKGGTWASGDASPRIAIHGTHDLSYEKVSGTTPNAHPRTPRGAPLLKKLLDSKPESSLDVDDAGSARWASSAAIVEAPIQKTSSIQDSQMNQSSLRSTTSSKATPLIWPQRVAISRTDSVEPLVTIVQQSDLDTGATENVVASPAESQHIIRLGSQFLGGSTTPGAGKLMETKQNRAVSITRDPSRVNITSNSSSHLNTARMAQETERSSARINASSPVMMTSQRMDSSFLNKALNVKTPHLRPVGESKSPSTGITHQRTLTLHKAISRVGSSSTALSSSLLGPVRPENNSFQRHPTLKSPLETSNFLHSTSSRPAPQLSALESFFNNPEPPPLPHQTLAASQRESISRPDSSRFLEKSSSKASSLAFLSQDQETQLVGAASQFRRVEQHGCLAPWTVWQDTALLLHSPLVTEDSEDSSLNTLFTPTPTQMNHSLTPPATHSLLHEISHILSRLSPADRLVSKDLTCVLFLLRSSQTK